MSPGPATARLRRPREWIAFLDDDDFWVPTRLSEHLRAIADAGASWGYGAAISVGTDRPRRVMMPAPPDALEEGLLELNAVGPPSTATVRLVCCVRSAASTTISA